MAAIHDFTIDQGATWNRVITIANNGVPVNLTGFTGRMQLRRTISQDEPDLSLTTQNDGLVITPLTGQVAIGISAAQSADLSGKYYYDLELVSGLQVSRWLEGTITVSREVTR